MSATDELRAELTKRGVEWNATDTYRLLVTSWKDASGHDWAFMEHRDGNFSKLTAYHLTPAQAITATLGAGTCHNVGDPSDFCCSECGTRMFTDTNDTYTMIDSLGNIIEQPNFCPNCGRRVTEVTA